MAWYMWISDICKLKIFECKTFARTARQQDMLGRK